MGIKFLQLILISHCYWDFIFASSDGYELECVTKPVIHGEGPHWDVDKKILYFVDMVNQTVNSYDPKSKETNQVYINGTSQVTLVITVQFEEDKFVIGRGLDLVSIKWDGKSSCPSETKVLASVDKDKPQNRFNDGKVDSSSRLWAGTIGPENPQLKLNEATLYSFEPYDNFKPVVQLKPVSISNGIAWNSKDTLMYYIDSPTRRVDVFDFDIVDGKISNQRTLFKFDDYNITGVPDGMAIDENDNIWVAVYKGSSVLHIDTKTGKLISQIKLPVTYVTSCAFGGHDLEDLYITTSKRDLKGEELKKEPNAGSVFRLSKMGVKGQNKQNKIRIF